MSLRLRPSLTTWRSGSPLSPGSGGRYRWEQLVPRGDTTGGYNRGYNGGPTGVLERNQTRLSVPSVFASRCDSLGTPNPEPGMIDIDAPSFSDNQASPHCPHGPVLVGEVDANVPRVGRRVPRRVVEGS